MAGRGPQMCGGSPQGGLASEAWLVLESRRKGLRSQRTAWGAHTRGPQETPLSAALHLTGEGGVAL